MSAAALSVGSIVKAVERHRPTVLDDPALRPAAVLVPVVERPGGLTVLLTRRTDEVEHHKGQISFPGGACDSSDESPVATALRETEEEIGLARGNVRVVGLLDDRRLPTGFRVTPVVGIVSILPELHPHPAEVSEILDVPLAFFLDPANEQCIQRTHEGRSFPVYVYRYGRNEIWGATAGILKDFLTLVTRK